MKLIDITGNKYGMLTVIGRGENSKDGHPRWKCICDCGNVKALPVSAHDLKNGAVVSCGCVHTKIITKHGYSNERLYQIWHGMIKRCENPKAKAYKQYGARDIKVCDAWHDYIVFREWALHNGYNDLLTLDRCNNEKGYSPDNCRWATATEQSNNRRNNTRITVNGVTHTSAEWARIKNVKPSTIRERYKRGVTGERLFSQKRLKPTSANYLDPESDEDSL